MLQFQNGNTTSYLYSNDGGKRKVTHQTAIANVVIPMGSIQPLSSGQIAYTSTTDYCGNVIYEDGILSKILTDEGHITLSGSTPTYHYYLKDHLGNNRVMMAQSGTVEQINHYYPFGGLFGEGTATSNQAYKYNGKELDRMHGLDWYDHGARNYDAALPVWTTMDPLAEEYYDLSPYTYCAGNPIACRDENGEWINFVIGAAVGAVTDYAVQVATNIASGQDFGDAMTNVSGTSIALAAGAGAMGVGIASGFSKLATVGKLTTIASKSETAATFVKTAANVTGDATTSVAGSVLQGKDVTVKGVVADVVGGTVARKIETNIKTSVQNSPAGKTLQNQADRAQRVASGSNPRQSRLANAKTVTTKANNYGVTKAYAAGTTGGNATSKAVEAVTSLKKPEEKK